MDIITSNIICYHRKIFLIRTQSEKFTVSIISFDANKNLFFLVPPITISGILLDTNCICFYHLGLEFLCFLYISENIIILSCWDEEASNIQILYQQNISDSQSLLEARLINGPGLILLTSSQVIFRFFTNSLIDYNEECLLFDIPLIPCHDSSYILDYYLVESPINNQLTLQIITKQKLHSSEWKVFSFGQKLEDFNISLPSIYCSICTCLAIQPQQYISNISISPLVVMGTSNSRILSFQDGQLLHYRDLPHDPIDIVFYYVQKTILLVSLINGTFLIFSIDFKYIYLTLINIEKILFNDFFTDGIGQIIGYNTHEDILPGFFCLPSSFVFNDLGEVNPQQLITFSKSDKSISYNIIKSLHDRCQDGNQEIEDKLFIIQDKKYLVEYSHILFRNLCLDTYTPFRCLCSDFLWKVEDSPSNSFLYSTKPFHKIHSSNTNLINLIQILNLNLYSYHGCNWIVRVIFKPLQRLTQCYLGLASLNNRIYAQTEYCDFSHDSQINLHLLLYSHFPFAIFFSSIVRLYCFYNDHPYTFDIGYISLPPSPLLSESFFLKRNEYLNDIIFPSYSLHFVLKSKFTNLISLVDYFHSNNLTSLSSSSSYCHHFIQPESGLKINIHTAKSSAMVSMLGHFTCSSFQPLQNFLFKFANSLSDDIFIELDWTFPSIMQILMEFLSSLSLEAQLFLNFLTTINRSTDSLSWIQNYFSFRSRLCKQQSKSDFLAAIFYSLGL